jgi:hypothetical protein
MLKLFKKDGTVAGLHYYASILEMPHRASYELRFYRGIDSHKYLRVELAWDFFQGRLTLEKLEPIVKSINKNIRIRSLTFRDDRNETYANRNVETLRAILQSLYPSR